MSSHQSFHSATNLIDLLLNLEGLEDNQHQYHHIVQLTGLVAFISRPQVASAMKAYRAIGSFRARKRQQDFSHDLVALNEDDARHRVYSNFGSRHGVPRRFVSIDSLEEISPSESIAATVVAYFRDTAFSEEE